ncbi:Nucleoside diphosphate-linked moiety X motif 14, partial [Intoshia linei]
MESNKKIECVLTEELNEAKYQHPLRFNYKINGIMNTWEVMLYYDCVEILIFNITRNVFIFVKQFRPPVYLNKLLRENNLLSECLKKIERKYYLKDLLNDKTILPASHGYTIELCAGLIDRKDTALNIANAEVFEEVGYSVKTKNMHKINTYVGFRSCTGLLGNETSIYFAVVEDCDKTSPGGGIGNENIEIIEVAETEMENFIKCTPNIPNVLHFSYM